MGNLGYNYQERQGRIIGRNFGKQENHIWTGTNCLISNRIIVILDGEG